MYHHTDNEYNNLWVLKIKYGGGHYALNYLRDLSKKILNVCKVKLFIFTIFLLK